MSALQKQIDDLLAKLSPQETAKLRRTLQNIQAGLSGAPRRTIQLALDHFGEGMLSTIQNAGDSDLPFETGFKHPAYNLGKVVIIAEYQDKDAALAGHKRLLAAFKQELPDALLYVSTSGSAIAIDAVEGTDWRLKPKETQ